MLGDITAADEIYIVTGRTDMRKSIDGLCAIVEDQLHMDPRRSALYLFCGKRCDRIKALLWESDGFVLLYKRMEVQGRFRWPRNQLEAKQLTEYSNAIVHAFQKFRAPFSGKIVHIFPEQSAVI